MAIQSMAPQTSIILPCTTTSQPLSCLLTTHPVRMVEKIPTWLFKETIKHQLWIQEVLTQEITHSSGVTSSEEKMTVL